MNRFIQRYISPSRYLQWDTINLHVNVQHSLQSTMCFFFFFTFAQEKIKKTRIMRITFIIICISFFLEASFFYLPLPLNPSSCIRTQKNKNKTTNGPKCKKGFFKARSDSRTTIPASWRAKLRTIIYSLIHRTEGSETVNHALIERPWFILSGLRPCLLSEQGYRVTIL